MAEPVKVVRGSVEYLYADIRTDRVLDTQPVAFAFTTAANPSSWISGSWVGSPGEFRSARVLMDGSLTPGLYNVFARITDNPEAPVFQVGRLRVT